MRSKNIISGRYGLTKGNKGKTNKGSKYNASSVLRLVEMDIKIFIYLH